MTIDTTSQAEAPEDAEVAAIQKRHNEEEQSGPPKGYERAWYNGAHGDRAKLLAKLRARTSQAEAQEDAEVAAAKLQYAAYRQTQASAKETSEKYAAWAVGAASVAMNIAETFLRALQSRTSQAEAQAPTTAAQASAAWVTRMAAHEAANGDADIGAGSLKTLAQASALTEDERHIVQFVRNVVNGPCPSVIADHQARHLLRIIDRLTVGAPAPAPARERTLQTLLSLRSAHNLSQYFESGLPYGLSGYGAEKIADALFAKGDTP